MKAVILAGGYGTRLSEETHLRPKPMVEIGGLPILWHILKHYSAHGVNDFVVCAGYKGYLIKEYFSNYFLHTSDVTFDFTDNQMQVHQKKAEPWRVTIIDTGEATMTGGRLLRVKDHLDGKEPFCFTYGDGLSNIDLRAEIAFHREHGKLATVAAVQPPGRYGALTIGKDDAVEQFQEKEEGKRIWINGGFFVLEPEAINYIRQGDATVWEQDPLQRLVEDDQLVAFRHRSFWRPMDTLRDKIELETLWNSGSAPWKMW